MAEPREASDVEALGEVMLIQATMQRQFLRIVLRRLATDIPAFNAELLLAEIDLLRESLTSGRERSALHAFALKEWERLSQMALDAIASTRVKAGHH
jgi:aminoglycoside/choline kinase family phosphotransferase